MSDEIPTIATSAAFTKKFFRRMTNLFLTQNTSDEMSLKAQFPLLTMNRPYSNQLRQTCLQQWVRGMPSQTSMAKNSLLTAGNKDRLSIWKHLGIISTEEQLTALLNFSYTAHELFALSRSEKSSFSRSYRGFCMPLIYSILTLKNQRVLPPFSTEDR